ncbi:MAG TPA: transglycosylase domain-containing protein [Streptosporangiaceae bacterium]
MSNSSHYGPEIGPERPGTPPLRRPGRSGAAHRARSGMPGRTGMPGRAGRAAAAGRNWLADKSASGPFARVGGGHGGGRRGGNGGYGGGGGDGYGGGRGGGGRRRAGDRPVRTGWRRYLPSWKIVLGVCGLGFLGACTLVGVAYAMTPVPKTPNQGVQDQASIFYYRDGKTEIGRIGVKRQIVDLKQVPPSVQDAVLAAENRSFRTDPGFSPTGIARAVWNNVRGGATQGGSTITQQLAKNYYSDPANRTMSRKFKELFISVKLENKYDKDQILQLYLNTIYFGRDTYGIQAAAQEYFHTNVSHLRTDQAALLAGIIQNPNMDPRSKANRTYVTMRYDYVLDGMASMGRLSPEAAAKYKAKLPKVYPASRSGAFSGQNGYLLERAKKALAGMGITDQMISKNGYRVVTTWDKGLQDAAKRSVEATKKRNGFGKDVRIGLASIDASSGEVLAAYGGPDYLKQYFDDAFQSQVQAGSSFKPYVLAAGLEQGIGLKSLFDTRSPQTFGNHGEVLPKGQQGYTVHNDSNESFGVKDLVFSTAQSLNTVYVPLGLKAGLDNVVKSAENAGIPKDSPGLNAGVGGIALGQAALRPLDQAAGFATFANKGRANTPHSIKAVYLNDIDKKRNKPWKRPELDKKDEPAFGPESEGIAADATYAMQAVVKYGTGTRARLPDGRPVAGKTGTTNENKAAWFVGYTPQVSTAVAMWRQVDTKKGTKFLPLRLPGVGDVYGGRIPAEIWRDYMTVAMDGKPVEQFPPPANVGEIHKYATPKPTVKPTPTPNPNKFCDRFGGFFKRRCQNQTPTPTPTCQQQGGLGQQCPTPTPTPDPCLQNPFLPGCRNNGGGGGGGGGNSPAVTQELSQTVVRTDE